MNQTHKTDFGQFVASSRIAAGLTQKQLATRVFVTESAVSKWERGLSYPDLATVTPLARALGVSEGELVVASEDNRSRLDAQTARTHRRWHATLTWTTLGLYAAALVTSLIVNLSVSHTLSWFWIVASAVMLAFSLTTLPLLLTARGGWTTLGAAVASLGLLLASIQFTVGGTFFTVVAVSVLFGVLVIWGPLAVRSFAPGWLRRHGALVCVMADGAGLVAMLWVILDATGHPDAFISIALPVTAWGLLIAVAVTAVLRYLPVRGEVRAAVACLIGAAVVVLTGPVVTMVLDGGPLTVPPARWGVWTDETVNGNVSSLTAVALGVAALVLLAIAAGRSGRQRATTAQG
ncbi:MAG: helix-turn-helix transcriptional regulator [Microbacterium enclense]